MKKILVLIMIVLVSATFAYADEDRLYQNNDPYYENSRRNRDNVKYGWKYWKQERTPSVEPSDSREFYDDLDSASEYNYNNDYED